MAKHKRIPWAYCECGCHGHAVNIGPFYYWLYDDLEGTYFLKTEHAGSHLTEVGRYRTRAAVDRAVRKHAASLLRQWRADLDKAEAILA